LASINLAAHINKKEVDWRKLEESVRLAVRQLDNLIDINVAPIPEAEKSNVENRAMGLGVMGFSDTIEQLGMAYDSEGAYDFADRIFEFVSYMAIDESANLAETRGSYMNFQGSRWSQGMVPVDTLKVLEEERGVSLDLDMTSKHKGLNWDMLRTKVSKGMRNATLMAVAPNANIGLLVGTTPGIDPRFSQIFSRNKFSGKYIDINHNLVKDLKNMGLWEKVKDSIVEQQGDLSEISSIPNHIKEVYKTSFTTSPYAFIEVAARAQKWVDQALSRNMYLETRDMGDMLKIYGTAWKKGLKSTYYLHLKPRHTAEQSTIKVNKTEKMGKLGAFASIRTKLPQEEVAVASMMSTADLPTPMNVPIPATANIQTQNVEMNPTIEEELVTITKAEVEKPGPFATALAQPQLPLSGDMGMKTGQPMGEVKANPTPLEKSSVGQRKYNIIAPSDPGEANICDGCA
jgi:ribonucleoside-diphosphate reductase alpha chain